jgi:F5/8 type C domain
MTGSRNARAAGLASLGYILLSVAYTWPLAIELRTAVAHDLGDPLLNAWILWWSGTQAVPLTAHWWNAPIFYPATGILAFSEHLLGLAPISTPLILLTHNPLVGYNVALIAAFALSALGAHFLAYTITRRHDVSVVAAVAFAFAPYRLAQTPHIQVLSSYWTPVCLAALHRYDRSAATRWIFIAAAAWVMQALACGYYLFFSTVLIALWLGWFALGRWPWRRLAAVVSAFAVGGLLLVPFLRGYQSILRDTYGLKRSIGEIRFFSADVASLLLASEDLLVWGWVHVFQRPEAALFPGLAIIFLTIFVLYQSHPFRTEGSEPRRVVLVRIVFAGLLVVLLVATVIPIIFGTWRLTIGGVRLLSIARADKPLTLALFAAIGLMATLPQLRAAFHRRSILAFYLLAALAMWVFALGPDPTVMDQRALYQAPYGWLMRLPGFDGLRVPARFWAMALACLSVVGALAVDRLVGRRRQILVMIAVAGLLLDGWPRVFPVQAAPEIRPSPSGSTLRLDLPMIDDTDAQALYQQMFDHVPLVNGFSGYSAPHYYALRTMLKESDPRILQVLAARGPLGVVIDHAGDADGALRKLVLAAPGATIERMERDWSSYRVPQSVNPPDVPDLNGALIRIKSLSTFPSPPHAYRALDGMRDTRWSGGPQQQSAEATIELDHATHVGQLVIEQGEFVADYPRTLQIDVSADGSTWEHAWTGDTALQAYLGALRHPKEVPLVLPLNRDGVRFIRLRQVGFGPRDWSIAELQVRQ